MSSTNRGTARIDQDQYMTPDWCIQKLLPRLDWSKVNSFFEPCRGDRAIYDAIPLPDSRKGWAEISQGRDYLKMQPPVVDLIITNPPYNQAQAFIELALAHSRCVIMLLRLNFLESQARYDFWQRYPPTHIITLSKRPSFVHGGTDSTGYAWFVWDTNNTIRGNTLQWII